MGYTFNDHPFKLLPDTLINGPKILNMNSRINFMMHLEKDQPFNIYFNGKGLNMDIYS